VLSLDTTAVLLTPVVLSLAAALELDPLPFAFATVWLANTASLLLPVSNLTNLLAMPHLNLTFTGFALRMAPVLAVVLLVEYVGLRLLFRRELGVAAAVDDDPPVPLARFPMVVVVLMLVGFAAVSPLGIEPWWVSLVAALVLASWARRARLVTPRDVLAAAQAGFAVWVLALGVVVAALGVGFLGDLVARAVPGSTSYGGLLVVALMATLLASALTNLSATLLLVPLIAPLGTTAVLATLMGLNIGSGLTWTGSLANLLWRRTLGRLEAAPGNAAFHRVSLLLTPVTLLAAVTTLWLLG
jgi:arsenical pump membrane protein